jgi:O-antigen chain-terminating methyltransferase
VTDQELAAAIQQVRDKARALAPEGPLGVEGVRATDLMPLVHARDAAEAKVAAIGTVNPRPPGLTNSLVQAVKRWIARALDWHVREQVEFNRAAMACVQATLEALTEISRGLAALTAHHRDLRRELDKVSAEARESAASRAEFEQRYLQEEVRMLRTIAELQAAYQHRLTVHEEGAREQQRALHRDYLAALERSSAAIQQRIGDDLARIRRELEDSLYQQVRVLRQRAAAAPVPAATQAMPAAAEPEGIDWLAFAHRFRGDETYVRARQDRYVRRFAGAVGEILDVGCGRGEFLEAARAAGLSARGIELNQECVALCRQRGLEVERADLFAHLESLPEQSLGGVYCSQVVEHLRPAQVARFVELAARKLRPGAWIAIETPNPECLAIFATHFYIDPTHVRPVPAALLRYYLQEAGCGEIEVEYLEPAIESMPELAELPERVRNRFFGGLDYAIFARKL